MKYVLVGSSSGEVLTYQGRVLVHSDREELAFLFPNERVVPMPGLYANEPTMELRKHPDMSAVIFPIAQNMNQFR